MSTTPPNVAVIPGLPPPIGAGVQPVPPTSAPPPTVPAQIVVGASSAGVVNTVKEWAHSAGAVVGLLMLVYAPIVAGIHQADPSIAAPDVWVSAVGGGIIAASKAIDSWSFTNLNAPVSGG